MKFQAAASVLEAAMEYSPHNPHLKISALFVYAQLNAAPRAWALFQTLHVKHIQYESLSYLILPVLWSGGMYVEAVCVCKDILRLQRSAAQDTGEYSGRAMDSGALSKADEFVRFHRDRMNRSLTCLEAKGIILEGAPLYVQDDKQPSYGAMQGIVGGPDDTSRVYEILANVMDPFSAFSVLQLSDPPRDVVDNRDFDVLSQDLLIRRSFAGIKDIANATMRRGLVQGLLIRSALVKELTKGPKKGKVVPPSAALRKRCKSLLSCTSVARGFYDASVESSHPRDLLCMRILILECHILTVLSSGLVADSMDEAIGIQDREGIVCSYLDQTPQAIDALPRQEFCVASVSQMLPECILPVFTLFNMCSEVFDLFGWGKRKNKKCAEGLAVAAKSLGCVVRDMISCLNWCVFDVSRRRECVCRTGDLTESSACSLSHQASEPNPHRTTIVPEFVTEESYSRTAYSIAQSQMLTVDRICRILLDIQAALQSYNIQE
jgi:N-terminal acetyltransferase B complex non-catalytic subunit